MSFQLSVPHMSHKLRGIMMAPDSHTPITDNSTHVSSLQDGKDDPSTLMTLMTLTTTTASLPLTSPSPVSPAPTLPSPTPLPNGILFKGRKLKKRVSFRDSNLVTVREIPPRTRCALSSEEEEEEDSDEEDDEEEEDSESSDSDEDSDDSDSDEEEKTEKERGGVRRPQGMKTAPKLATSFRHKAVTVTRFSPSLPANTSSPHSPPPLPRTRPERVPVVPSASTSSVTTSKGSYQLATTPASRVVSIVSQITGVSSVATQTHIKQRNAAAAAATKSAAQPKKVTAVLKVEKKVKKISPSLDNVVTSQTVRSVQNKHGVLNESLHKTAHGKNTKKKKVTHSLRRHDGGEKRKLPTPRKAKESKHAGGGSGGKVNGTSCSGTVKYRVVNGLSAARDSLTLPPLGSDDTVLVQTSKPLPHRNVPQTPIFSLDGFIFPGDPASGLAAGVRIMNTMTKAEDTKLPLHTPKTPNQPKERIGSAPPSSPGRRKRYYAWQMANGNLESSLQESPSITPMYETVATVASVTAKTAHAANR